MEDLCIYAFPLFFTLMIVGSRYPFKHYDIMFFKIWLFACITRVLLTWTGLDCFTIGGICYTYTLENNHDISLLDFSGGISL